MLRIAFIALFCATCVGCARTSPLHTNRSDAARWVNDPKAALHFTSKTNITDIEFLNALSKLGLTNGPAQHWTRIANDTNRSLVQRQKAALQLFYRCVHTGMTLTEVASFISPPLWLQNDDMDQIKSLTGKIPVDLNDKDTTVVIRVLPERDRDVSAVYMRWSGKIPEEAFRRIVLGESLEADKQKESSILQELYIMDCTYIDNGVERY